MTNPTFDGDSWERRWEQALREHPDKVSSRPSNEYLLAEIGDLQPGFALDAGCGHGAEAIWLAAAGWRVTAVDFSVTALEHARSTARTLGEDIAEGVDWGRGRPRNLGPRPVDSTSSAVFTSTWPGRWARCSLGSVPVLRPAGTCSWSGTFRWTRDQRTTTRRGTTPGGCRRRSRSARPA